MRSGITYTHDRFMDVVFVPKVVYADEKIIKFKARWFNTRGMDLRVTTKHCITREKAKEFYPYEKAA